MITEKKKVQEKTYCEVSLFLACPQLANVASDWVDSSEKF